MAKYTGITPYFVILEYLCVASSRTEFLRARKCLTSLRWFVQENFLESRRAPRAHTQMSKNTKYGKSCKNGHIYTDIMHEMNDSRLLCFSGSSREFLQARKYLTNLRLFVKKKLFRSRRVPHAYTEMSKLQNMTKIMLKRS
jgi:hypothetical protein